MTKKTVVKIVLGALLVFSIPMMACSKSDNSNESAGNVEFKTELDKVSYIIGYQIGTEFKQSSIEEINTDLLSRAVKDVLAERDAAIPEQEMGQIMQKFMADLKVKHDAVVAEQGLENKAEADAFLAENTKKEGVTTLPDNLQYEVLEEGSGPKPKAEDTVRVHYRGTFVDGTEFDSSYAGGEPVEFPVQGVIAGWTEVLQLMNAGSKWKVVIPPELGYGEAGFRSIPPSKLLIFEMELIEIVPGK